MSEHRNYVLHVNVGDLFARDAHFRDGGEGNVVLVEHTLEVQHGLAPVLFLLVVLGNVEPGVACNGFGFALDGDEVFGQIPEVGGRLEQYGRKEQVAGTHLLGDDGLVGGVHLGVVAFHERHADRHVSAFVAPDVAEGFLEHRFGTTCGHLVEDGGGGDFTHEE